MKRCKGVAGFLLGHKFFPCFDEEFGRVEISSWGEFFKLTPEVVESMRIARRTYIRHVCERCGESVLRAVETPESTDPMEQMYKVAKEMRDDPVGFGKQAAADLYKAQNSGAE